MEILFSSIFLYVTIILDKTRRIRSKDKPKQARVKFSKSDGFNSIFKELINLVNSLWISSSFGN